MRYFFDTEFDENGITICLISIGIVCDDGREYYGVSTEFDPSLCNPWVQANVLPLLPSRDTLFSWQASDGQVVTTPIWKPRQAIASEILDFVGITRPLLTPYGQPVESEQVKPEFWANVPAYDWVALVQLYGRLVDLPKGMPYDCNNLKQLATALGNPPLPQQRGNKHDALMDARWNRDAFHALYFVSA